MEGKESEGIVKSLNLREMIHSICNGIPGEHLLIEYIYRNLEYLL